MKRKSQKILILVAVAGVAATGFLLFSLFGDDASTRRQANKSADTGGPFNRFGPGGPQEVQPSHPKSGKIKKGGSSGGIRPGAREPFDSPGTSEERRQWTTRVLEIMGLIQTSKDPTQNVKLHRELKQLIRGLGSRVPQSVRDELLAMIDSIEPRWRRLVGDTLGGLSGDKETAKKLLEKLRQRPEAVQTVQAITLALGNMNVAEAIPELDKMLRADFPHETEIVRAIANIGGRQASALLSAHLTEPLNSSTRIAIERALSQLRDPATLKKLEEGLADIDEAKTRRSFYSVLGNTRDARYSEGVRRALENEREPRARKSAIRALGLFGDPKSGKALLDMIERGAPNDKTEATRALYFIQDSKTVNELAENWNTLHEDARVAVMGAAARVAKPSKQLNEYAVDGLRHDSRRMRGYSAQALGKQGNDRAVPHLLDYINRHRNEKSAGLQALNRIRTKAAAEAALSILPRLEMHKSTRGSWERKFKQLLR